MTVVYIILWMAAIICTLISLINAGKTIFKADNPTDPFLDLMEQYDGCQWLCWAFMFLSISWMFVAVI